MGPGTMVLLYGIIGMLLGVMVLHSFRITGSGEAIDVFQFGTYVCTYWPRKANDFLDEDQQRRYDARKIKTSWFFNIVFWLWPIWQMRKIPTATTISAMHAGDVFTKGTGKLERMELETDPSITLTFLILSYLLQKIVLPKKLNLFEPCEVTDVQLHYTTTGFGKWIRDKIGRLFLEVVRQVASGFVWDGEGIAGPDDNEIVGEKLLMERMTLWQLSAPESIMSQAKILVRPPRLVALAKVSPQREGDPAFLEELILCAVSEFCGPYTLSVDINLTDLDLALEPDNAPEAQKAVNAPYVGKQKAKASKHVGFAEARVIAAKGKANAAAARALQAQIAGADPATIAALQLLREGNVTFNTLGTTIPDILRSFGGSRT